MNGKTLTKADIVDYIYEKTERNRAEVKVLVDHLLDLMKQAQENIPLKALVTPSNKNWVFGDLLAHLQEEHTAFTAAKETAHA